MNEPENPVDPGVPGPRPVPDHGDVRRGDDGGDVSEGLPPEGDADASPPLRPNAYREPEPAPEFLASMLRLCHVPRWGTVPMWRHQSVAEHSFRVAAIAMHLSSEAGSLAELSYTCASALTHDADEAVTGDIPATQKPMDEPAARLSSRGDYIVKLADAMEAFTYLGNYGMKSDRRSAILDRYRESIVAQVNTMVEKFGWSVNLHDLVDNTLLILQEAK